MKSIILRDPEVRALLDTGRVVVVRPVKLREFEISDTPGYDFHFRDRQMRWHDVRLADFLKRCPIGVPGDRRWVREAWQLFDPDMDDIEIKSAAVEQRDGWCWVVEIERVEEEPKP